MRKDMLTGNSAIAYGVKLAEPQVIPVFPITPQTEIIEQIGKWIASGELKAKYMLMESEHSAISAAIGASLAGARTFTATSSQGLVLMHEMLYIASGTRSPIVMANVSRGLSAPVVLGTDQNDILGQRDTGWLQFHCETCQEALDSVLIAYRVCEGRDVMLPGLINIDGFILSFTREPVSIPDRKEVEKFLPDFEPQVEFSPDKPISQGVSVLDGESYTFFKAQQNLAMLNALRAIERVQGEFAKQFGRKYGLVEKYMMEDAEYAFVVSNAMSAQAKAAVRKLREAGMKIGTVRLRVIRPFPSEKIVEACNGLKGVAVIDRNSSPGAWGITFNEVRSALYDAAEKPTVCNFIDGLGGKAISLEEFVYMAKSLEKASEEKKTVKEFVFTEDDNRKVEFHLKEALGKLPDSQERVDG